jgi:hypothetical protein
VSLLAPLAPRPTLADHPAFALMLLAALEKFRCTLGEVREDYWLGRMWRALSLDPALEGRVARLGLDTILVTGPGYGPAPSGAWERERWRLHVQTRIEVDTARTPDAFGMRVRCAQRAVAVTVMPVTSLLAQTVVGDPRWEDLTAYRFDLAPVFVPVAQIVEGVVAA